MKTSYVGMLLSGVAFAPAAYFPGHPGRGTQKPAARGTYRVVAIGDGITRGSATAPGVLDHANTVEGGWVSRLRERLDQEAPGNFEVINEGIDGETAAGVLDRLEDDVFAWRPNIVILGVGTNDAYGDGMLVRSAFRDYATNAGGYRVIMTRVLEELKRKAPEAKVYIMGLSTPLRKYWNMCWASEFIHLPDQGSLGEVFFEYNAVLRELARDFRHEFVDLSGVWPADVEASWEYYADGIHPNDAGYEKIATMVHAAIDRNVREKN